MKNLITICKIIGFVLVASASPALAIWTGDTLTGVLDIGGSTANYFDPVNGYVPAGSSGIQPTAVVADPDGTFVEFMYLNGYSGINVDVDAASLTVHQFPANPGFESLANSWDIYITGFDVNIASFVITHNTIPGFTASLLGKASGILLSYPGSDSFGPTSTPDGWQATLSITPVPAPGAILLGSIGVGLVGWLRRRRTL